jgi:putative ABC transport system substrate-binding protein
MLSHTKLRPLAFSRPSFLALLVAFPLLAQAQAASVQYRVAQVFPTRVETQGPFTKTIRERLAYHGYVEGKNLELRFFSQRTADANADPIVARQRVVDEVMKWQPHVIITHNFASTQIFQKATTRIPIVFALLTNPVGDGFIESYSRPGGNITGAIIEYDGLSVKRLEVVRSLLPTATRVLLVADSRNGGIPVAAREALNVAAVRLGFSLAEFDVMQAEGGLCDVGKHAAKSTRPHAVIAWGNIDAPPNYRLPKPWGARRYGECLAITQTDLRVPVLDDSLDTVDLGVAVSLGEDQNDSFRRATDIAAKILAGAKPATTPVDIQMRMQMHINGQSLRELAITLPPSVRMSADRVTE